MKFPASASRHLTTASPGERGVPVEPRPPHARAEPASGVERALLRQRPFLEAHAEALLVPAPEPVGERCRATGAASAGGHRPLPARPLPRQCIARQITARIWLLNRLCSGRGRGAPAADAPAADRRAAIVRAGRRIARQARRRCDAVGVGIAGPESIVAALARGDAIRRIRITFAGTPLVPAAEDGLLLAARRAGRAACDGSPEGVVTEAPRLPESVPEVDDAPHVLPVVPPRGDGTGRAVARARGSEHRRDVTVGRALHARRLPVAHGGCAARQEKDSEHGELPSHAHGALYRSPPIGCEQNAHRRRRGGPHRTRRAIVRRTRGARSRHHQPGGLRRRAGPDNHRRDALRRSLGRLHWPSLPCSFTLMAASTNAASGTSSFVQWSLTRR